MLPYGIGQNDSIPPKFDTSVPPTNFDNATTVPSLIANDTLPVKVADKTFDSPVEYNSEDSMYYDIKNKQIHLYGNAVVKYQGFELSAGYIVLDWGNNLLIAEGQRAPNGKIIGKPNFNDGERSPIKADKLKYNYITGKGKVYQVTSQEAGGYIVGDEAKFIRKQDSTQEIDDVFYSTDAIYTSCDLNDPHFGIRSQKQKVILNKMVVVGPSNLEVGGIPTPLWLPFGFFPLTETKSSGLIFPKDYEFSPNWGFGLRNLGWHFPLGEYANLNVTGDVYTRGSWGLQVASTYYQRYRFRGNVTLGYSVRKQGDPETPTFSQTNAFNVRWSHNQDPKAHPTQRFNASVNFQTNNYLSDNNNDAESVLKNSISSNITYSKSFPGKPYRLTINGSHSQNTQTRQVKVNLPTVNFNMNRVFPFERKKVAGRDEAWFEKIGLTYTARVQNSFTATDTTLFKQETLDEAQFGVRHDVPIGASFRVFKYFNFTPSVNYSEKWYINTIRKELKPFDPSTDIASDTLFDADGGIVSISSDTTFGVVQEFDERGFRSLREFNAGASLSTQLFGMANFKRGYVRAIRHVAKPSVSFTYTPDYTNPVWGYYDSVQTDIRYPFQQQQYSIFEGGLFGSASLGGSRSIGFNMSNVFEGKVVNKADSITGLKKVTLIRSLTVSTSYNLAADSLNMSTINLSGNTTIFKDININFGAVFDPYAANPATNARINTWEFENSRRLARATSGRLSITTRISSDAVGSLFNFGNRNDDPLDEEMEEQQRQANNNQGGFGRGNSVRTFQLGYEIRLARSYINGIDSLRLTTHTLSLSGTTVNLTKKWQLTVGSIGYDFVRKEFTYPDFRLYRNLHCWEMGLSWQPQRSTYSFFLRVSPQSRLNFINIPYKRNNYDPLGGF